MELPIYALAVIMIGVIVFLVIVAGIINPIKSGSDETNRRADFTLLCNRWAINDCSESYYSGKEEEIKKVINCFDYGDCRRKCEKGGFCSAAEK